MTWTDVLFATAMLGSVGGLIGLIAFGAWLFGPPDDLEDRYGGLCLRADERDEAPRLFRIMPAPPFDWRDHPDL